MSSQGFDSNAFSLPDEQQWDNYNLNVYSTPQVEQCIDEVSLQPSEPYDWYPNNDDSFQPSYNADLLLPINDLNSTNFDLDSSLSFPFFGSDDSAVSNDFSPAETAPTEVSEQEVRNAAENHPSDLTTALNATQTTSEPSDTPDSSHTRNASDATSLFEVRKPEEPEPCQLRSQPKRLRVKADLEARHACPVHGCDKDLSSRSLLNRHLRSHSNEKTFACSVCGKKFARNDTLKKHNKIHTGEKPFACSVCDKRFTCRNSVKKHTMIHTGEKPFACSVCDKRFTQNGQLKKHMRIHMGERSFVCSVCDKRFMHKHHLKDHERTHTDEKRFARKHQLEKRARSHPGGKESELFGIESQTAQNDSSFARPASAKTSEQQRILTGAPSVPVNNPTLVSNTTPTTSCIDHGKPTLSQHSAIGRVPNLCDAVPLSEVKNWNPKVSVPCQSPGSLVNEDDDVGVEEPPPTHDSDPPRLSIPGGATPCLGVGNQLLKLPERGIDGSVE